MKRLLALTVEDFQSSRSSTQTRLKPLLCAGTDAASTAPRHSPASSIGLGDPDVAPARARNLLRRTGVINEIRLTFGATSPIAPSGAQVIEKK
jgi:hypothetical protein